MAQATVAHDAAKNRIRPPANRPRHGEVHGDRLASIPDDYQEPNPPDAALVMKGDYWKRSRDST
jgi:hypothetical protein